MTQERPHDHVQPMCFVCIRFSPFERFAHVLFWWKWSGL